MKNNPQTIEEKPDTTSHLWWCILRHQCLFDSTTHLMIYTITNRLKWPIALYVGLPLLIHCQKNTQCWAISKSWGNWVLKEIWNVSLFEAFSQFGEANTANWVDRSVTERYPHVPALLSLDRDLWHVIGTLTPSKWPINALSALSIGPCPSDA